jgi:hypothetical protein
MLTECESVSPIKYCDERRSQKHDECTKCRKYDDKKENHQSMMAKKKRISSACEHCVFTLSHLTFALLSLFSYIIISKFYV